MAQYTTTIEIYAKSLTSEYTLEPHLYRRIENKIENTRKLEDVLWEAIEIEGLDNKKLYVEITIEDDTGYVDSESFFMKSRVVRTETPDAIKADFGSSCTVMENGDLMIRLGSPSEKKTTMTRLVENYDIDEVKVFEPSLNDIFVEYAGDVAQED